MPVLIGSCRASKPWGTRWADHREAGVVFMNSNVDLSSAENLNEALRLYRRLVLGIGAIAVIGFVAVILLAKLGTALSPPYGIYIFGEGLGTWGLIAVVAALVA